MGETRTADLELMLWAMLHGGFHVAETHGGERDGSFVFYPFTAHEEENEMRFLASPKCAIDEAGIPILTDEVRATLRAAQNEARHE